MRIIDSIDWDKASYDEAFTALVKKAKSEQPPAEAQGGLDPNVRNALIGAALGGGVGLLGTMGRKKKRPLTDILAGALLGGAGGVALPAAANIFAGDTDPKKTPEGIKKLQTDAFIGKINDATKRLEEGVAKGNKAEINSAKKDLYNLRAEQASTVFGGEAKRDWASLPTAPLTDIAKHPIESMALAAMGTGNVIRGHRKDQLKDIQKVINTQWPADDLVRTAVQRPPYGGMIEDRNINFQAAAGRPAYARPAGIDAETTVLGALKPHKLTSHSGVPNWLDRIPVFGRKMHEGVNNFRGRIYVTNPVGGANVPLEDAIDQLKPPNTNSASSLRNDWLNAARKYPVGGGTSAKPMGVSKGTAVLRGARRFALPFLVNSLAGNVGGPRVSKIPTSIYGNVFPGTPGALEMLRSDLTNYDKLDDLKAEAIRRGRMRQAGIEPGPESSASMEDAMKAILNSR